MHLNFRGGSVIEKIKYSRRRGSKTLQNLGSKRSNLNNCVISSREKSVNILRSQHSKTTTMGPITGGHVNHYIAQCNEAIRVRITKRSKASIKQKNSKVNIMLILFVFRPYLKMLI